MEEKNTIQNSELQKVAGGTEVGFADGQPYCPICGKTPIRLVSSDEFTDTYQCDVCGHQSVHTRQSGNPEPEVFSCPRCGNLNNWKLLKSENGIDTVECMICHMQVSLPSGTRQ